MELYKVDKKRAVSDLLERITVRMKEVWQTAEDYDDLMRIQLARNVYKPSTLELTQE